MQVYFNMSHICTHCALHFNLKNACKTDGTIVSISTNGLRYIALQFLYSAV